jgi:hypothetical protein
LTPSRITNFGPVTGEGGHWHAAGIGLQQHNTEGVGQAGKDEDVCRCQMAGQILASFGTSETNLRVGAAQGRQGRPVADHPFPPRQVEIKEGGQVFFRGHPANKDKER